MKNQIKLDSDKKLYSQEEVLEIYEKFNVILNDVINVYEQEIACIYYQNTFKNKIKRNVKKIIVRRK